MFVLFTPKFLKLIKNKKNVLFLSNWNLNNFEKKKLQEANYSSINNEWSNIEYKRKKYENLKKIQDKLLVYIKDFYNNKFNNNYSEKFYKHVFSEWLWSYTHVLFDRIETVKKLKNYNNLELYLIDKKNYTYVHNNLEFVNKSGMNPNYEYDNFNLQIYSILVKEYLSDTNYKNIYFENKKKKIKLSNLAFNKIQKLIFYSKIKLFNLFKLKYILIAGVYRESNHIFHHLNKIKELFILKLNFDYFNNTHIDYYFRNELGNLKNSRYLKVDDDLKIYFKLLKYYLPLDQCENFIFFNKLVNHIKIKPSYIFSFASNRYNSFASYINAINSNNGTKIYGFQHGGGYFMHNNDPFLETELENCDLYFSYGHKSKKVIPFSNFKKSDAELIKNNILYLTTDIMRGFNKIFEALEGPNFNNYFLFQKVFYSKLNQRIINILKIKMYNHSFDNNINKDIFRDSSILNNHEFNDNKLNKYKLFIIDANQTSFIKILSKNVPFIILWHNNFYIGDKNFNSYLQKLQKLKIYFADPNDAANYLNNNYENHIKIWYSREIQQIILEMINRYARSSANPKKSFIEIISRHI